ncbi:MAG TPA: cell division protein FtsQ/DivIB [Solirubrobacteraceae bacterium]|nr:cell division protein FtsQ/DivIB [Solirubrobacteraceae bacterium]
MPPTLALPRRAVAAPRLRRPSPRLAAAVLAACLLLGGGWLWLRESSLVAVRDVTVVGASGPQAGRIAGALRDAARDMTTLHVREDALRTAVEPYPVVKGVDARPDFPHGLRIVVHEHVAVAALAAAGQRVAVAADGTVLRDTPAAGLPTVSVRGWAPGGRLEGAAARAVAVLAAAPPALRARVRRLYLGPKGWTAPLIDGPVLYLGDSRRATAKWAAAARVLTDAGAAGATYLDVRLPERPAAGDVAAPSEAQQAPAAPGMTGPATAPAITP